MRTNPAEVRLSPQQQFYIARQSDLTGRPWDELLREIIPDTASAIPGEESALRVAERLGLIGVCVGAPSDLSSNPDHLSGFGE